MPDPLLFLDTRPFPLERREEILAARRSGRPLIVATDDPAGYGGLGDELPIEHIIEAPIGDYRRATEVIVEALAALGLRPGGCVAWGDREVELAARVGEALGLPCSTPAAAANVRDKARTRTLLEQLPGANPPFAIVHDLESFREGIKAVGVPALLKPRGASFGRGIFAIDERRGAEEIFAAFAEYCSPDRDPVYGYFADGHLLEQRLDGTEHSVSGMVAGGEVYVFSVTDKLIDHSIPIQYQNTLPSRLPEALCTQIVEMARRAVQLVGIDRCGFHLDVMVTEAGPRILEIGGRLGGECINSHLIPAASDGALRPYDLLLDVVRGGGLEGPKDRRAALVGSAGVRAICPPGPGVITRLDGLDELASAPEVDEILKLKGVGDRVSLPRTRTGDFPVAFVLASSRGGEEIGTVLERLASTVEITVEIEGAADSGAEEA